MRITEVRVRLVKNKDDRLKAFCSMTVDHEFVIRDIKVIEGTGGYFVAMPCRKMSDHCEKCGGKNHLRAKYCNNCGLALQNNRGKPDPKGRIKFHADVAHPINLECRRRIQREVVVAYEEELERSKLPGYKPLDVDMDVDDDDVPEIIR
jgi:stage V sporulation protein G